LLKRFGIGAGLIIVLATAATTASALLFFDRTADKFRNVNVGREITPEYHGGPQTIMLAGSDRRHGDKKKGLKPRSDTIILMRVDPNKGIALLSLPRDLKVSIPGHGSDKINAAYTLGGPKLAIKTVKQLTHLKINHYIDVNFRGFQQAVDEIGCVFVDVDRRYFNDNSGLGYGQQYAAINVRPGYQKMCGARALEYVRYRHTDTDISRNARQQDFMRYTRAQITFGKLIKHTGKLIDIFADNTASDIHSGKDLGRSSSWRSPRKTPPSSRSVSTAASDRRTCTRTSARSTRPWRSSRTSPPERARSRSSARRRRTRATVKSARSTRRRSSSMPLLPAGSKRGSRTRTSASPSITRRSWRPARRTSMRRARTGSSRRARTSASGPIGW
jgi:polyisoprenyl-teichoic acid--peptidoglycan teichoic acid transferase